MPEDLPDRMPEDMSDRMPEDLPVRKCKNVTVGITRSKVIFFAASVPIFESYLGFCSALRRGQLFRVLVRNHYTYVEPKHTSHCAMPWKDAPFAASRGSH